MNEKYLYGYVLYVEQQANLRQIYFRITLPAEARLDCLNALFDQYLYVPSKKKPPFGCSVLHILLQPPQPLLRPLQHLVLLAYRKPQPILRHPLAFLGVEFRRRDGGHAQLHDQEPAEFEIARAGGEVRGERVGGRERYAGEVGEDEVAA